MPNLGVAIVHQYERGVVFRLGEVRNPWMRFMIPLVDKGGALSVGKLAEAADVIAHHPVALQLRNLQILSEIAVEKNSTIIFPAQFMESIRAVEEFLAEEMVNGPAAAGRAQP